MYNKMFLTVLSLSIISLSSCIRLPEEKVGVDPIFINEDLQNNNSEELNNQLEEVDIEGNNEETKKDARIKDEINKEINQEKEEVNLKNTELDNPNNSQTSDFKKISDEIEVELETETEIKTGTGANTLTGSGDISQEEVKVKSDEKTGTGEELLKTSSGENL